MVEPSEEPARKTSNVDSDLDLTDLEHCILCYNDMKYFVMGKCEHKNVCHKCCLRIRLIMKDDKCSICKAVLDEVIVSKEKYLTWDDFEDKKNTLQYDREDQTIFYEDGKAKGAGMQLRQLTCLMHNCNSS